MSDSPDQTFRGGQRGVAGTVLSCTSCRHRKVKCNKTAPCDQCLESGIECIYPTRRTRPTRAQRDASKARDQELLARIRHLERLLANNADAIPAGSSARTDSSTLLESSLDSPFSSAGVHSTSAETGVPVDDHYAAFIKEQKRGSRHLNDTFWSSLSDEFEGLKQLIENPLDDEDDPNEGESTSTDAAYSPSDLLLNEPKNSNHTKIVHPPNAHSVVLWQFFFKNVDPVCKILHRPTGIAYFSNLKAFFHPSTRRFKFKSLEALTFAAYFAAVTSMSSEECLDYFGDERDILSARYKYYTEKVLIEADYLNNMEIPTLQGFTIYIMAQQTHTRGQSNWALVGVAMRIAQGLGLHQEGDGRAFNAFEAEMRRRLFWQIFSLDMRASEDRGNISVFAEHSFNTTMPCNLNDEDFGHESQHPLHSKSGHTDMTYCLLEMDALLTISKLNTSLTLAQPGVSNVNEREDLVRMYIERVKSKYLANCDFSDRRTNFLRIIGQQWTHKLWLSFRYPLHHQNKAQGAFSGTHGLKIVVELLKSNELIENHPFSIGFAWLLKTYAPWHAVAVALAEICHQPHSFLADSAWAMIQAHFEDWNNKAPGTREAMVWYPIKNLLRCAREARERHQESSPSQKMPSTPYVDSTLSETDASTPSQSQSGGHGDKAFDDFESRVPSNFPESIQAHDFSPLAPMGTMMSSPTQPDMSSNFDYWNNFTYDVNALSDAHPPEVEFFGYDGGNTY